MKSEITVIDLFAGAGGLSEGFLRKGFKIISYIEKDKYACETLLTRHIYWELKIKRKTNIYMKYIKNDISKEEFIKNLSFNPVINAEINAESINEIEKKIRKNMEKQNTKEIDVFIGGPPCQAYSLVSRTKIKEDDIRIFLYRYYIELLKKFRPKIFVFENVPGILSFDHGKLWNNIQEDFKNSGYTIEYSIMDASNFMVLQKRKRIILIGWRIEDDFKYPKFSKKNHNFLIKDLLEDLPPLTAGEKYGKFNYILPPNTYLKKAKIRNKSDILIEHEARPANTFYDKEIYKIAIEKWAKDYKRINYRELPEELQKHKNRNAFSDRFKVVAPELSYSQTIMAHIAKDGHYYIHPDLKQLRSISVREAARLQSFPDNYKFEGSRTSQFVQIGNAVPPLMAEVIAKKIRKMVENYGKT